MPMPTAAQAAAKWTQNLGAAGQRITDGVNAVTVAPGQVAARNKTAYVNGVQAKADKWASRTAAVPLNDWQQSVIQKGVPRIASGAQAAQPKMEAFMAKFLPYTASGVASLPARGGLEANIARSAAMIRHSANFKG